MLISFLIIIFQIKRQIKIINLSLQRMESKNFIEY